METVVLLFTVLLAVSAAIFAMVIISMRKRRRRVEEDEQHRKAEQDAKQRAEEKERQQLEEKRRKTEEKRKRLEDEAHQKAREEEKRRKAQEKEQRRKAEKEARERAEKEELGRPEVERQKNEEERRKAEGARKRAEKESQHKTEETRGGGRRPPLKRGGRPRGPIKRHEIGQTPGTKPQSLKPEIVCWNKGVGWILGIEVPEGLETPRVAQSEELLEQDNIDKSCYRLKQAQGAVKVTWTEGEKDIPLMGEGRNYFVFKMRKNWEGLGRLVGHPTTGYYLAIIPQEWKRNEDVSGTARVEPESVQPEGYNAHFFYREKNENTGIGFITGNGLTIQVESENSRFQLVGREIGNASEEMGPLFGEQPPRIRTLDKKGWSDVGAIVVGEEGSGRNRWRTQFVPQVGAEEQELPKEITNRRGGWYFLRIYDSGDNLLESMDLRFLTALNDICMEKSACLPGPNGYDNVTVQFIHQADCKVELLNKAAQHALKIRREDGQIIVTIPPKPDCDKTHWILRDGNAKVEVTVLLERIWWAFGTIGEVPTDWVDKPITLSRKEFTAITDKALWMRLPRLRFVRKIDVGFERTKSRSYQVEVEKKEIAIPLLDFCDAEEIQNPTTESLFQIFIDSQGGTCSATMSKIRAFFKCKKCDFITDSEGEALLHMKIHLFELIPHLSYRELYERFSDSLPFSIYQCSYCNYYVSADDAENPTSKICSHIELDCQKVEREHEFGLIKIKFRVVSDPYEIRKNVISGLPHIYKCRICGKEFQGDNGELRLNHLQENHKSEIFEVF